jgi:adenylosuccinate lyase
LHSQVSVAFENIPLWHERDLSNYANERSILPISAIILDEMLQAMTIILDSISINEEKIKENLEVTRGQIFSEFVLEALIKKGVPRFEAYREIQKVAFESQEEEIDFREAVRDDKSISSHLTDDEFDKIFIAENHLGASFDIIKNVATLVRNSCSKFS